MSSKERLLELNARLAQNLTDKGVEATADETTTSLIDKVADIQVNGGVDYLSYAKTITFSEKFSELTEDVYLDLSSAITLYQALKYVSINCEKITLKVTNLCKNLRNTFQGASNDDTDSLKTIEIVGDTSGIEAFVDCFRSRKKLESILGEIDFSGVIQSTNLNNIFLNSGNIKEIYPKARTIKVSISFSGLAKLIDESIQAIIDGFADMTGQTAPVLTVHATVKAKIVADEEKDDTDPTKRFWLKTLTSKNVTLA